MKIDDYRLLVELSKTGTIRSAATNLMISQPAISQRLKHIERDWGVELFIRTPKQLLLTPAGEKVVGFAKEMILEERRIRDEVNSLLGEVGGVLSLGVSSVIGQYVLPPVLEKYIDMYPKVQVNLTTGLSNDLRKNFLDYHIAIIRGEKINHQPCQHLFSDRLFLIDLKKFEKQQSNPRPLIAFQGDDVLQSAVQRWFIENDQVLFSQMIKVDQIETCKQLMKSGMGMAVLPETALGDLGEEYTYQPLVMGGEALTRETWITYSNNIDKLPQAKAFIDLIDSESNK
ncbi:LysR family transcriptional regulator [Evansella sp. AB-rgal1]|uniref:LysR family transcriptional regulator n=1 Tax=Evansella sp. AB-rgal1 TaxID=3242696 RepID=UPI00359CC985